MVKENEIREKTLDCQILKFEESSGIMLRSRRRDDNKLCKLLAYYDSRGRNIYPIYENGIVDNVTIDNMDTNKDKDVRAFFVTKETLTQKHNCSEYND